MKPPQERLYPCFPGCVGAAHRRRDFFACVSVRVASHNSLFQLEPEVRLTRKQAWGTLIGCGSHVGSQDGLMPGASSWLACGHRSIQATHVIILVHIEKCQAHFRDASDVRVHATALWACRAHHPPVLSCRARNSAFPSLYFRLSLCSPWPAKTLPCRARDCSTWT